MTDVLNIESNPKILKGRKKGYMSAILHLAPAWLSGSFNLCPKATAGCAAACLNSAGHGGMGAAFATVGNRLTVTKMNTVQAARIRKTHELMNRKTRAAFLAALVRDIERLIRKAERAGLTPVCRLNGTSDLRWETMPVVRDGKTYPHVFAAFPNLQFYDYTKIGNRKIDDIPNYHLTFSLADGNEAEAEVAFAHGMNVAAVVRDPANPGCRTVNYPETWNGRPTIDGDDTDLRFLDPKGGHYVLLRAKGKAQRDTTGFVHDIPGIAAK